MRSAGGQVRVQGNIAASGDSGVGISAGTWDLVEPVIGAAVSVDGKINAAIPLRLESLPVEKSKYAQETTREGYLTYTDGTNTIWVRPGGGDSSGGGGGTSAPVETPKTEINVAGNTATVVTTVTAAADSAAGSGCCQPETGKRRHQ